MKISDIRQEVNTFNKAFLKMLEPLNPQTGTRYETPVLVLQTKSGKPVSIYINIDIDPNFHSIWVYCFFDQTVTIGKHTGRKHHTCLYQNFPKRNKNANTNSEYLLYATKQWLRYIGVEL